MAPFSFTVPGVTNRKVKKRSWIKKTREQNSWISLKSSSNLDSRFQAELKPTKDSRTHKIMKQPYIPLSVKDNRAHYKAGMMQFLLIGLTELNIL